ncbi:hypothetical protein DFH08DRAFT_818581 [Mycena albidolilacea]|uniref:Uncharacterized protein n=1 Tax=Mycena albidolilacea TaxID=1033008 RepID=A0AAD6ZG71_9AGAR|nr:hypothetical protein DFH08DRAFT_818581 [Mycena albidolilacea]
MAGLKVLLTRLLTRTKHPQLFSDTTSEIDYFGASIFSTPTSDLDLFNDNLSEPNLDWDLLLASFFDSVEATALSSGSNPFLETTGMTFTDSYTPFWDSTHRFLPTSAARGSGSNILFLLSTVIPSDGSAVEFTGTNYDFSLLPESSGFTCWISLEVPVEPDIQPDVLEQVNNVDGSEASQSESGNVDVDGEVISMGNSDIIVPPVVSILTSAPSPIPPLYFNSPKPLLSTRRSSRKQGASKTHEDAPVQKSKKTEAAVAPKPSDRKKNAKIVEAVVEVRGKSRTAPLKPRLRLSQGQEDESPSWWTALTEFEVKHLQESEADGKKVQINLCIPDVMTLLGHVLRLHVKKSRESIVREVDNQSPSLPGTGFTCSLELMKRTQIIVLHNHKRESTIEEDKYFGRFHGVLGIFETEVGFIGIMCSDEAYEEGAEIAGTC